MGIQDVNKVIGCCSRSVTLSKYEGQSIGIDARNYMYKFLRSKAYQHHEFPILKGFLNQINTFRKHNIKPIYVIDGAPPEEKQSTLEKRKAQSQKLLDRIDVIEEKLSLPITGNVVIESTSIDDFIAPHEDQEELELKLESLKIQTLRVTREHSRLCRQLFAFCNVGWIDAPGEADEILAKLNVDKKIAAVLSSDMDLLAYGVDNLITSMKRKGGDIEIIEYKLETILERFSWSFEQFREFCILCGCDYIDRIKYLGVKTAKTMINTHFTIENIVASIIRDEKTASSNKVNGKKGKKVKKSKRLFVVPDDYMENVQKARNIFSMANLDWTHNEQQKPPHSVDEEDRIEFFETHELPALYSATTTRLTKKKIDKNQTSITSFFSKK